VSIDEWFAECGRALNGSGNNPQSPWPEATPQRLAECDPSMYEYMSTLIAQPPARESVAA
jgi:hypothetical protein